MTLSNLPSSPSPHHPPEPPPPSLLIVVPLWIIAVMLVIFVMHFSRSVLVPIALALLLATTLQPIVRLLRWYTSCSAGTAALLTMILVIGVQVIAGIWMAAGAQYLADANISEDLHRQYTETIDRYRWLKVLLPNDDSHEPNSDASHRDPGEDKPTAKSSLPADSSSAKALPLPEGSAGVTTGKSGGPADAATTMPASVSAMVGSVRSASATSDSSPDARRGFFERVFREGLRAKSVTAMSDSEHRPPLTIGPAPVKRPTTAPRPRSERSAVSRMFSVEKVQEQMTTAFSLASNLIAQWLLVMFMAFFFLAEGDWLLEKAALAVGQTSEGRRRAVDTFERIGRQFVRFMVMRTLINLGLGLCVAAVCWAMGVKYWQAWAVLAFVMTYVPYLGPVVATVPPCLLVLLDSQGGGLGPMLLLFAVFCSLFVVEGYIAVPMLMGKSLDLNATTVMVACMFWWFIWGEIGLVLAIPFTAALRLTLAEIHGMRYYADMMSAEGKD